MNRSTISVIAAAVAAAWWSPANALCIYNSQLYAKTTLDQEFHDSKWVVRAKVISAIDRTAEGPWTLYRLKTVKVFKGHPPRYFPYYNEHDSGGFPLDVGVRHDIGGEYLLFLNPISEDVPLPPIGRRATVINYNCGQSGPWIEVGQSAHARLDQLSQQR